MTQKNELYQDLAMINLFLSLVFSFDLLIEKQGKYKTLTDFTFEK